MDDVDPAWATVVDWEEFSLRVSEEDVAAMPAILKSVSSRRIQHMQAALAHVWQRFMYTSYPGFSDQHARHMEAYALLSGQAAHKPSSLDGSDAFATLIQWLHGRINDTSREVDAILGS